MVKFKVGDRVKIIGIVGIYTVEGNFEQMYYIDGRASYELTYSLKNIETGYKRESVWTRVMPEKTEEEIKQEMNDMLDTYNTFIMLENIYQDGRYARQAQEVIDELNDAI
jgi:hypothetical protein